MRILFVSAQIPGHLDWGGYLSTAVELQRRGHSVLWATGQAMAPLLKQASIPGQFLVETGWRWPPPPPWQPPPSLEPAEVRRQRSLRALDQWLELERVRRATADLITIGRTFQPDLIVSEVFTSAAGLAAEALAVPFVIVGWPAQPPRAIGGNRAVVDEAHARLRQLCDDFAVTGINWEQSGPPVQQSAQLHVTYWSPRWYTGMDLLPQNRHVGGNVASNPPPAPNWPTEKPWVFISLGASFGRDPNFFVAAARAADELGCLPILALSHHFSMAEEAALRAHLPQDVVVEQRVDFAAVLPHIAAAIHQGGAGVTHAMILHAIPQIIVPHAAEHGHQAQGVVRSGVGLHVAANQASVDALVQALAQTLPDLSPLRAGAQKLRDEFAQLGGVPAAADLLEQATHRNRN
ncbi:MAG: hypothetical protein R3C14_30210 [Caldilineaceae bacterium]